MLFYTLFVHIYHAQHMIHACTLKMSIHLKKCPLYACYALKQAHRSILNRLLNSHQFTANVLIHIVIDGIHFIHVLLSHLLSQHTNSFILLFLHVSFFDLFISNSHIFYFCGCNIQPFSL
jgi:hypothetical protein